MDKVSQAGDSSQSQDCSREQEDNLDLPSCTSLQGACPAGPARRRRWLARGAAVRARASRRLRRSAPVRAVLQDSTQFPAGPAAPARPPPAPPRARLLWLLQAPKVRCLLLCRSGWSSCSRASTEGREGRRGTEGGRKGRGARRRSQQGPAPHAALTTTHPCASAPRCHGSQPKPELPVPACVCPATEGTRRSWMVGGQQVTTGWPPASQLAGV